MKSVMSYFESRNKPSSWLVSTDSILDWDFFLEELAFPKTAFTVYIREFLLYDELRKLINRKENNVIVKEMIIEALNKGMVNQVFYEADRVSSLRQLDIKTQDFVINSYKLKDWLLVKANRIILETEYSGIISPRFSGFEASSDRVNALIKRIDRRLKIETSMFRLTPSFLVAGVQRCGTSSLFYYLCQHPNILHPEQKELHFFNRPAYWGDLRHYKSLFPLRRFFDDKSITGEATPEYSFYPAIMKHIQQVLPEIKIILIVRDPVQRAISHYYAQVPHRRPASFRLAVQLDQEIFANRDSQDFVELDHYKRGQNYIARGRYIDYIPFIYQCFPKQNILLLRAEDMFEEPLGVVNSCLDFLGMDKLTILNSENHTNSRRESTTLLRSLVVAPEKLDTAFEAELYDYFLPYNRMFYEFVERDMKWDK